MIYILMPVHNRLEVTSRFLRCLSSQQYQDYHLVLIDDGSSDGTAEMVKSQIQQLSIIKGNGNLWWGGALQQGYQWVKNNNLPEDDFVLIINNDTQFGPEFLSKGIELLQLERDGMAVASCFSLQTGKYLEGGTYQFDLKSLAFSETNNLKNVNCMSTRGLFLRVGSFLKTGGFRPWWLPHYLSDIEFTLRGIRQGLKPLADPGLKLYVDEKTSGYRLLNGESFFSFLKKYFSKKFDGNPIYFMKFVLLTSPGIWKLINVIRIGFSSTKAVCKRLVRSLVGTQGET